MKLIVLIPFLVFVFGFKPYRGSYPNPLDWVSIDFKKHESFYSIRLENFSKKNLSFVSGSKSKRAEYVVDLIHDSVLSYFPEARDIIPKPIIKILDSDSPNGAIYPVPVCIKTQIVFEGYENKPSYSTIISINSKGLVFPVSSNNQCVDLTQKDIKPVWVIDFFKRNNPSCEVKLVNDLIVLGNDCKIHKKLVGRSFSKLLLPVTSNIIVISSGAFDNHNGSFSSFEAIIAHELAHYYRSHASMWTQNLAFFYNNPTLGESFVKDDSLTELGDKLLNISNRYWLYSLPDQKIPSVIILKLWNELRTEMSKACSLNDCHSSCRGLVNYMIDKTFLFSDSFPKRPASSFDKKRYYEFETLLFRCAESFKMGTGGFTKERFSKIFNVIASGNSLRDSLSDLFRKIRDEDNNYEILYKRAYEKQVGYYTFEQEADEIAVYLMKLSGLRPEILIEKLFSVLKKYPEMHAKTYDWKYEKCFNFYKNNWRDQRGLEIFVPVGNYADPHHSKCHRIYNIDRLLKKLKNPLQLKY